MSLKDLFKIKNHDNINRKVEVEIKKGNTNMKTERRKENLNQVKKLKT